MTRSIVTIYLGLVYATGLLTMLGLVSGWGVWYSYSYPYRAQTDALLRGRLALEHNVMALEVDNTWSERGVQQVWGLGVPLWRLPWEALARHFGFPGFPDRLAFGLFAAMVATYGIRVWNRDLGTAGEAHFLEGTGSRSVLLASEVGVLLVLFLFPAFLTLLTTRMAVWEEAIAYEYLYGILEVLVLVDFARKRTNGRWWFLCTLAGIGGLLRPTLGFYGFATMAIGTFILIVSWSGKEGRRTEKQLIEPAVANDPISRRWPDRAKLAVLVASGFSLFLAGNGVLWLTNKARFGNGFEFGHRLNVQPASHCDSMYATRFDYPFQDERWLSAGKELAGALFFSGAIISESSEKKTFFPGKSRTVRWRRFYFRTYDSAYFFFILLSWGSGALIGLKRYLGRNRLGATESGLIVLIVTAWSFLAFLPLAIFYMHTPVITSRYLLDFGPAFAAAIAAGWLIIADRCRKTWSAWLGVGALTVWIGLSGSFVSRVAPARWQELVRLKESARAAGPPRFSSNGEHWATEPSNIPFDGVGWDHQTGEVTPLTILFLQDPQFLELSLETKPNLRVKPDPTHIRVKVGLEFLERSNLTRTKIGWRIRFRGPRQENYRHGIQVAFLAMVPKEHLADESTPWLLKGYRWLEPAAQSAEKALPGRRE